MKTQLAVLSILFFLLTIGKSSAQNIAAKGVILEKGTSIRIALALVTDTNNHVTVGSNDMGFFQIKAKVGDTLWFFKRHFQDQFAVVSSERDMVINLIRADMILEDVIIKAENKQENLLAVRLEHRKKTYFYGKKRNPLHYFRYPIAGIMELFGSERRNAKRFDRHLDEEEQEVEVDRLFNLSLVKAHTNLTGKALEKFMVDFRPKHEQIKNWNTYDAAGYIRKSATFYLDTLKRE
ncbi:hypothetical protein [Pedobacter sp. CFBP9032]|uniref:hypothetical protein n=1 Tax=Pedobacter sp. CFBP9032 TaxID=3096539 RepID=UPI002A6A9E19|nr:hypothetical protein [Pedobacter sp. CFBP9032]MDY0903791.1 hypothetical protein [Pedobacter sp. CFBP9032]